MRSEGGFLLGSWTHANLPIASLCVEGQKDSFATKLDYLYLLYIGLSISIRGIGNTSFLA